MKINCRLENLEERIKHLEDSLEQSRLRNRVLVICLGWLMARQPKKDALYALRSRDSNERNPVQLEMVDELREMVLELHKDLDKNPENR